jgi:nitroreductase
MPAPGEDVEDTRISGTRPSARRLAKRDAALRYLALILAPCHPNLRAMTQDPTRTAVDAAITSRRSVRAFLPTPVPRTTVEEILAVASRAPSGTNIQPWKVHVLAGEAKTELSRRVMAAFDEPDQAEKYTEPFPYYPAQWVSPYVDRRRKIGWDMYGLVGIAKGDTAAMRAQSARNYVFFDAPVGLIFTMDRMMRVGGYIDCAMFMENIMIAARGRGLDTCPQQAFSRFHAVIADTLGLPENEGVICGMALGHADPDAAINRLVTEREPVAGFASFRGF